MTGSTTLHPALTPLVRDPDYTRYSKPPLGRAIFLAAAILLTLGLFVYGLTLINGWLL